MNDSTTNTAPESRGRRADSPRQIPKRGWWDIGWRIWRNIGDNRIMLVAAGATFYLLLALFPALAAFVSLYGLVADPVSIGDQIAFLGRLLPSGSLDIIESQLDALASQDASALSFGFVAGLVIALWSANNGIKTLFDALNIVYNEREKRSFIRLNLFSAVFTMGGILIGIVLIVSVGVVPAIIAFLRLGDYVDLLIATLRWPVMLVFVLTGISLLYRFGPSRKRAKWRWLVPGALFATIFWIIASAAFSYYLQNFADYNATYGSLGAVIGFMTWTWISVIILLVGAQLNAEIEHQTANDTTVGSAAPIGKRGAFMADEIGVEAP
ncbi:YihY/virulence factor BrkB family protein [Pararhizobium haloflavum]|uniref:YihY/virulence factor BrkB family protein n=1 Tax=Pararhizobium haloflavum TaxID=2037914 RepID=UPI000C182FB3|nr:YihY/virulence factor BrkB family protein [Pararhizobium haloflavum]